MKQGALNMIIIIGALIIGILIFNFMLPKYIKDGGPLVAGLVALSVMVLTYVIERLLSLKKAGGKGPLPKFLKTLIQNLNSNDVPAAIAACDAQRGSMANIVKSGLERYQEIAPKKDLSAKERIEEVKRVIDEATMLEMPVLEKNLVSISTIASISTMVGLLGTVIGMIRSFAAMANAGAPDATQLSLGISEALINTAGGISIGIAAIVAYNFFTTKIDGMTYMIDEASKDILTNLQAKHE
jgi:biopolymer transport protein ExbB